MLRFDYLINSQKLYWFVQKNVVQKVLNTWSPTCFKKMNTEYEAKARTALVIKNGIQNQTVNYMPEDHHFC